MGIFDNAKLPPRKGLKDWEVAALKRTQAYRGLDSIEDAQAWAESHGLTAWESSVCAAYLKSLDVDGILTESAALALCPLKEVAGAAWRLWQADKAKGAKLPRVVAALVGAVKVELQLDADEG